MKNRQEPELIEVLGEDGYLLLLEAFGGQVTYIPKGDGETVLSEAIGLGLATIMAEHYGGLNFRRSTASASSQTSSKIALNFYPEHLHPNRKLRNNLD